MAAAQSCLLLLRSTSTSSIYRPRPPSFRISRPTTVSFKALPPSDPVKFDSGGSGPGGVGGGGGRGGGGGGYGGDQDEDADADADEQRGIAGMSMSQKLTLAYAALVGVGGLMGYLKSGSLKSVGAGGLSSLVLVYVYSQLPVRPAFASALGLGISAALLGVMGSRFNKSKKMFPAGVVSIVSLIMVGGYLHGVLRSLH